MEHSWTFLSFALRIVATLLCSCLCLVDAIVELHNAMDEICSMTFLLQIESGFYM